MAPGGNMYKDIIESLTASAEYDVASTTEVPYRNLLSSRNAVASKPGMQANRTINELLECPVCMTLMNPPINQCPNGHTICHKCKGKVRNCCPICRQELGNIRCVALEKVARLLELPCKYQFYGCQGVYQHHSRLRHEQSCRFRPYKCPYAGAECSAVGDVHFLLTHLKEDHKVDVQDGSTFNHRYVKSDAYEIEDAMWMLTIFSCFGHHFCLHFEAFSLGTSPVYMAFLRFMGDENDAKKFCYSLEVGGNGRKMMWQGIPRSIRDNHRTVRDSLDGLIVHRPLALFFSNSDGQELKLKVAGRIWRAGLIR